MLYTNINISNQTDAFTYIFEYIQGTTAIETQTEYLNGVNVCDVHLDDILFIHDNIQYVKHNNHWHKIDYNEATWMYTTNFCKESVVRLYFPQFSVDTYRTGHKYAVTISTWICGKHIILGSYLINRHDALACDGLKKFYNNDYYEYIDLPILDPFHLMYSDDWKEWRQKICNESQNPDSINSVGSILQCTLQTVSLIDGEYVEIDGYTGGQSSINITKYDNNYLNLSISSNTLEPLKNNEAPAIKFKLNFNEYYDDLGEYLLETYGLHNCKLKYKLAIGNNETLFLDPEECSSDYIDPTPTYEFYKSDINKDNFESREGWIDGIEIVGSVDIISEEGESILTLLSNKIPFTKELYKYFMRTDFYDKFGYTINNVNLDELNMNLININAVNKTENKIIKVDRPDSNKANIYQTSFYRVVDALDIVIRPEVNENICINLDSYKHLVDSFLLQIEGVKFIEIGRLKSGIVFKVLGNRLPKKISRGQYYILNQASEVVTSGKYIYEV